MKPYEFEQFVCDHYRQEGYRTQVTSATGDYGVDVFAEKENEKIAVQAKMFGGSTRKVNRQTMMELYGAAAYFDCTKAVLATDGIVLADAKEVADKLGIEILSIKPDRKDPTPQIPSSERSFDSLKPTNSFNHSPQIPSSKLSFDSLWENYIMPLAGRTLTLSTGTNRIVKVDWSGVERITSNGKKQKIKIEIFRYAINRLIKSGYISREEINQNYPGRASSGIVMILSQVPCFRLTQSPLGLKLEG